MHGYLVLSVRRAIETLIDASRREKNVHVYLVLSIRRAMETLVNSRRRKTKLHVHVYLVPSFRRVIYTPEECDKC